MYWKPEYSEDDNPKDFGKIHVYTGEGKGKTTAALGLALRAAGHNKKVFIVQFLHGNKEAGEFLAVNRLAPLVELVQFGTPEGANVLEPSDMDKYVAQQAMDYIRKKMVYARPDVLILDEVLPAVHFGLIQVKDVTDFLENKHSNLEVVLTGRYAHPEILNRADLVTVMQSVKSYVNDENFTGRFGIEQ